MKPVKEDVGAGVPTNNGSGGQVAALGVGPQGEPGVKKKKKGVPSFTTFIKRKANVAS